MLLQQYQDNISTIGLAESDRPSNRTKHLKMRHFRVRELINNCEVVLRYKPTNEMEADIHTKPLLHSQFTLLRNKMMNIETEGFVCLFVIT